MQHGKWSSPGGSSRRFDSSTNDFMVTWYPSKLNSLIFGGADGEKSKDYLISIFLSLERSKVTQTRFCSDNLEVSMDDFKLDIELLLSRVDSIQPCISTIGNSFTNITYLENEVVRLRVELGEKEQILYVRFKS